MRHFFFALTSVPGHHDNYLKTDLKIIDFGGGKYVLACLFSLLYGNTFLSLLLEFYVSMSFAKLEGKGVSRATVFE